MQEYIEERGITNDDFIFTYKNRPLSMHITEAAFKRALKKYEVRDNGTYKIVGEYATIGVSVTTGRITTAWRTGTSTLRKIARESKK